jgi:hypothetical protein
VTKSSEVQPNYIPRVLQVSEQEIEDFEEQEYDLEDQEASKYVKDVTYSIMRVLWRKI